MACKGGGHFLARIYGTKGCGERDLLERTFHRGPHVLGNGGDDNDDIRAIKTQLSLCGKVSKRQKEPP